MKNIIINESQAKMLNEAGLPLKTRAALPSFMENNPFDATGYFVNGSLDRILAQRNAELQDYFSDDINSYEKNRIFSKLSKLITKCKKLEEPLRDQLERICNNVVVKIFGIPSESMEITCELADEISRTKQFHIKPDTDEDYEYEDLDEMSGNDSEVNKRRIINAISYGVAWRMTEQSGRLWINDVFESDEDLPHLYSQIMKINEYLVFNTDVEIKDESHKQGGSVETTLANEGDTPKVSATGVVFPILLHETIRGVVELLSSYGLPDDMSAAERVTNIADALENDPWNMRIGPSLWDKIQDCIGNFETENFPYFYKELVSMPTAEFERVMKNVFAGTRFGKRTMENLYEKSKYGHDYNKFVGDLALKQEKSVIEDDYFTDEEIQEWDNGE